MFKGIVTGLILEVMRGPISRNPYTRQESRKGKLTLDGIVL